LLYDNLTATATATAVTANATRASTGDQNNVDKAPVGKQRCAWCERAGGRELLKLVRAASRGECCEV
jgi:hypothetical protein